MGEVLIVDYGAGNLRSVARAVERVGYRPRVAADSRALAAAAAVIVPGVGAAADTMRNLRAHGLEQPIREVIAAGRPFLGVCMGMQALFSWSEEGGGQDCLAVLPGTVRRLPGGVKVPHMGWNTVHRRREHPIFDGIPDGAYFYFVHSFYAEPADPAIVVGETEYGRPFPALIARDNVVATQFHPEKSGAHGLRLYANFLAHALSGVEGGGRRAEPGRAR
jgi:glutamine amidotransferase